MEEDSIDIEAWRRVRLADEPIYCAAPTPANPIDIVCAGSDDELDDSAKVSKKLRYEIQGHRYLEGKPIRIHSASLRGPFDRPSGWQNPWLPKQPAVKQSFLKAARPPAKSLTTVEKDPRRRCSSQFAQQDEATPDTGDSMRCHLPSPGSNPEPQLFGGPLDADKHGRIRAWAKGVSVETLNRDGFWAPGQTVAREPGEPSRKRTADKDWLKTKLPKRSRLEGLQSTAAVSTPTPMPSIQVPVQHSAVCAVIGQVKESGPSAKTASQSFEMTTPSSSADLSGQGRVPQQEHVDALTTSNDASNRSPVHSLDHEETRPDSESINCPENISCDLNREEEEETSFESRLDQSFHYRARLPKQTASRATTDPKLPSSSARKRPSQTDTPESMRYHDVVGVAASAVKDGPRSPRQTVTESGSSPNNSACEQDISASARSGSCASVLSASERSSEGHQDLKDDKPYECDGPPLEKATTVAEAEPSRLEAPLDEEPTLVGDLMNIDQDEPHYMEETPASHRDNVAKTIEPRARMDDGTKQEAAQRCAISPLLPLEQDADHVSDNSLETKSKVETRTETLFPDATKAPEDDVPAQTAPLQSPQQVAQQSPSLVPEARPEAAPSIEHVQPKLADNAASPCPSSPKSIHPSSQTRNHETTSIRPSQQSPWVKESVEPTSTHKRPQSAATADIVSPVNIALDTTHPEEPQNPWETIVDTMPHHNLPAAPPTPEGPLPSPTPDAAERASRAHTPDETDVLIRRFANFQTPSPRRPGEAPRWPTGSADRPRGILSRSDSSGQEPSARSSRHVSFAPLPAEGESFSLSGTHVHTIPRGASPPPPAPCEADDDDVGEHFQNHFRSARRRLSGGAREPLPRLRLLRSAALEPEPVSAASPGISAVADAFHAADAHYASCGERGGAAPARDANGDAAGPVQSPWRNESQTVDDVADVMGNLGDFLGTWDVEAEMQQIGHESNRAAQSPWGLGQ
ncbi:hypothetical protein GGS23DRAFT_334016 [Durotheca rogersii]|uniref:uncharacterized protein n=1 Tax=Durotheca rogersii TaxID=419775 RepID=UPI0022204348|nr:uncharacterized protein GGS23DRAFT_334016 [Durotheca rogersii]KAI5858294.1 hypothetical protein GGS23DRAFT_334016 [Durotheca rogersii]